MADDDRRSSLPSRVDVFIEAVGLPPGAVTMLVDQVALRDGSGELQPLSQSLSQVTSSKVAHRTLLAGSGVAPGTYPVLEITLSGAFLEAPDGPRTLQLLEPDGLPATPEDAITPQRYEVPLDLTLASREAASIFLRWDVAASLDGAAGFAPILQTTLERPQVRLGRLYVADAEAGTVLAFERGSGQVVGNGKVGRTPVALASSRDRRFVYVANAGDGSLSLVDLRDNFAVSTVPIRLGAETSDVVEALPGLLVALTNPALDTVSLVDLRGPARLADVRVGRRPIQLAAAPQQGRIYVADSQSDDLSVVDISSREVVARVGVDAEPTAVAVDRREREVFVGHRIGTDLLVLEVASLAVVSRIPVGGAVTEILADRRRDRLYVARSSPAEIAVVDRRMGSVIKRIPVSGVVTGLAQPLEGPLLYGACPELGVLVVINAVLGQEEPSLPCGASPRDVVAID